MKDERYELRRGRAVLVLRAGRPLRTANHELRSNERGARTIPIRPLAVLRAAEMAFRETNGRGQGPPQG
jgi:hypothetical protein